MINKIISDLRKAQIYYEDLIKNYQPYIDPTEIEKVEKQIYVVIPAAINDFLGCSGMFNNETYAQVNNVEEAIRLLQDPNITQTLETATIQSQGNSSGNQESEEDLVQDLQHQIEKRVASIYEVLLFAKTTKEDEDTKVNPPQDD